MQTAKKEEEEDKEKEKAKFPNLFAASSARTMGPAKDIIWLPGRLRIVIEIAQGGNALLRSISPVNGAEEKTINPSVRDSSTPCRIEAWRRE